MHSSFKIHGSFDFRKLSQLLSEKLKGQHVSDHNTIQSVVMKGDASWLYTVLTIRGRFNGHVVAQFKLSADPQSPSLKVDDLNLKLEDGGIISAGANFIIKHFLSEKLRLKVQEQIAESMSAVVSEMMDRYGTVEMEDGLTVNTDLESYNIDDLSWDSQKLYCKLVASGLLRVTLE